MHVHLMGIGGSGVSGLALMTKSFGWEVSGCDSKESPYFLMVKNNGIECKLGHDPLHLKNVDLLVRSSAVSMQLPEVLEAQKRNIPVFTRGAFLALLLKDKFVIGIGGSHGKTSTTWMTYRILNSAGLTPSIYAGGKSGGVSTLSGKEPYIVELDESDGSIFEIKPQSLVITNLEFEHANFYSSSLEMFYYFERYLLSWSPQNLVIGRGYELSDQLFSLFLPLSFPTKKEIKSRIGFQNIDCYSFYSKDDSLYFSSHNEEVFVGSYSESFHLLQNRSAALMASVGYLNTIGENLPKMDYKAFWQTIPKVDRRFQFVGNFNGTVLIDDYAHHPSEIAALIEQAAIEFKTFCLVFQPHRFSRFTTFYDRFYDVLKDVEPIVILPVYSAGEAATGRDSRELYEKLKENGNRVYYKGSIEQATDFIKENLNKLNVSAIVFAGAGDLNEIAKKLVGKS